MSDASLPNAAPPYFAVRMRLFFAAYFCMTGVSQPFLPVWLEARGLSASEIANCIAIAIFTRVLLSPAAGVFADRAPSRRFAIRVFLVGAAFIFAGAWWAHGFWALLLFTGAASNLWSLALPMAEALALTGVRQFGLDYGRMRLPGSASFMVVNLVAGALIGMIAPDAIYFLLLFGVTMPVFGALALPVTPRAVRVRDDAARRPVPPARVVLAHPRFLALLLAGGLVQASYAMLGSFGSIVWRDLGYSGGTIGAFWATGVVCEIVFFAWSARILRRFGPTGLLALGAGASILRWGLFPLDPGVAGYLALQMLHGFTFGATYLANQAAIARDVPEELTASAQGVMGMLQGLLMAGATAAAGPIYTHLGLDGFAVMAVFGVAALAIAAAYRFLPAERH